MIDLTDRAAEHIRKQLDGEPGSTGIRIAVVGGGCSGFTYQLSLSRSSSDDYLFSSKGILLMVDGESIKLVDGMTLDYDNSLHGAGLVFNNPKATRICGCGTSFSTQ